MFAKKSRFVLLVLTYCPLAFAVGCNALSGGREGGNGDGDAAGQALPTDGEDQESIGCDVRFEPIREGDLWMINSDPDGGSDGWITVTGFGNVIEDIEVSSTSPGGAGCSTFEPEATLDFDGRSIRLEAHFADEGGGFYNSPNPDENNGATCSIELTGSISSCGNDFGLFPGGGFRMDIFAVHTEGRVTIGAEDFSLGALDLLVARAPEPSPCAAPALSLDGLGWSLANTNSLSLGFMASPPDDVFIDVSGIGAAIEFATVYSSAFYEDDFEAVASNEAEAPPLPPDLFSESAAIDCFAGFPDGSINFDGEMLSLTVELEGFSGGFGDQVSAESCTLDFQGTVVECGEYTDFFGFEGDAPQVLQIEGTGTYASGDQTGRFTTLYLTIHAPVSFNGSFDPAFIDLIECGEGHTRDPETSECQPATTRQGHVVIQVINNAEIDERLVDYLASSEGGDLDLTDQQRRSLRPRVRLPLLVTFTDGTFQTIEFITGTRSFIDPRFDASQFPDLGQNDRDNAVVLCGVASIELDPSKAIEVFTPVELTAFELNETTDLAGSGTAPFELRERISPQFRTLETDEVDAEGNVTLRKNIGIRDILAPVMDPGCGSVVAIVIDGVLSVPFLDDVSNSPSYDRNDEATVASIGGRYAFFASATGGTHSGAGAPVTPGPDAGFVLVRAVNGTDQVIEFIVTIEREVFAHDEQGDLVTHPERETVHLSTFADGQANELGVLFSCSKSPVTLLGLGETLSPTDAAVFVGGQGVGGAAGFGVPAGDLTPLRLDAGNFNCGDTVIYRATDSLGAADGVELQSFLLPGSEQPSVFGGPNTFVDLEEVLESQVRDSE